MQMATAQLAAHRFQRGEARHGRSSPRPPKQKEPRPLERPGLKAWCPCQGNHVFWGIAERATQAAASVIAGTCPPIANDGLLGPLVHPAFSEAVCDLLRERKNPREEQQMIRLIAAAGFVITVATSALAITPAPVPQPDGMITQVAYECGPFRTRIAGRCVPRTTIRHTRRLA